VIAPKAGSVIRYAYLWADKARRGGTEGSKDRPVLVIAIAVLDIDGASNIVVLAVTHARPIKPGDAVELPRAVKRELGLDDARSWIVTTEANAFRWPGPDIRPIPGREIATSIYGRIPPALLKRVAQSYIANIRAGRARAVSRTD
jgi:hypothetical protein